MISKSTAIKVLKNILLFYFYICVFELKIRLYKEKSKTVQRTCYLDMQMVPSNFGTNAFDVFHKFYIVYLYLLKPMSEALSLKHCLQMFKPYFLIKPVWEEQTLHCLEPLPNFLGWEYQTFS